MQLVMAVIHCNVCRSQWPRGLMRRSTASRLLRLLVRIPTGTDVCFKCRVLSGRVLCHGLITRPEKSYRMWCVVCDIESSWMRRLNPATGLWKIQPKRCKAKKTSKQTNKQTNIVMCVRVIMGVVNYRLDYKQFVLSQCSKPKFFCRKCINFAIRQCRINWITQYSVNITQQLLLKFVS